MGELLNKYDYLIVESGIIGMTIGFVFGMWLFGKKQ